MTYFFGFAVVAVLCIYILNLYFNGKTAQLVRSLRWILGGGALAIAAILGMTGRMGVASMFGLAGGAILSRGRLGPIDFNAMDPPEGATSKVRSTYFEMALDHDNGDIAGRIIAGSFGGQDLWDLGQEDTGKLLTEVQHDADSLSLLEAWLDANRYGWREYFGGTTGEQSDHSGPARARALDEQQAREILGVSADATTEEIKTAYHRLLKAVHPDQGGSNYLAARINEAKDFLLKK